MVEVLALSPDLANENAPEVADPFAEIRWSLDVMGDQPTVTVPTDELAGLVAAYDRLRSELGFAASEEDEAALSLRCAGYPVSAACLRAAAREKRALLAKLGTKGRA